MQHAILYLTRNIFDCDQSNVLLARIIFSCILLTAFSFLSFHTANSGADSITSPTASTVQLTSSRHVTPKGQTRDPIIFEAPYLHNGAR